MNTIQFIRENGLEALTEQLGIVVKERGNLLCLDYDQIESPRLHPVVLECRGLILEKDTYNIVFRSMSRFFNYGEAYTKDLDFTGAKYYDKVDGSLIKIYCYQDNWYIATRGTIIADNETPFGISFQDLVLKALRLTEEDFQFEAHKFLNPNISYNFEVTSIENRVVTRYEGYTLYYLNARDTQTGEYVDEINPAILLGARLPPDVMEGATPEQVVEYVKHLPDLREGLVAYLNGTPSCKFKSPTYVELHHKRGNGISLNGIRRLVILQEHPEYLSYFGEELPLFEPYIYAYEAMFVDIYALWEKVKDIEDQKEYANVVKLHPASALLFAKRKQQDTTFYSLFNTRMTEPSQFRLLDAYVQGL